MSTSPQNSNSPHNHTDVLLRRLAFVPSLSGYLVKLVVYVICKVLVDVHLKLLLVCQWLLVRLIYELAKTGRTSYAIWDASVPGGHSSAGGLVVFQSRVKGSLPRIVLGPTCRPLLLARTRGGDEKTDLLVEAHTATNRRHGEGSGF